MRGHDRPQTTMLTLVNPKKRVPANHQIRLIKALAEVALKELSPLFEQMYSEVGRPSIPPERLLKASLLMALYTRSDRGVVRCRTYRCALVATLERFDESPRRSLRSKARGTPHRGEPPDRTAG
jgi:Transposase domain (DUF772)